MDMRKREKIKNIRKYGSKCTGRKEHKKNVILQSPCVVMSMNVNDISNMRCHG